MDKKLSKEKRDADQLEGLVEELALEFDLPKGAIIAIITSPYKFIFHKMREEQFYNFSIPYIGKLHVSKKRKDYLKENYSKIKEISRLKRAENKEKYGKAESYLPRVEEPGIQGS